MGKLLCENNLRDVWCRNESVRAEIGPILQTHARVSYSSVEANTVAVACGYRLQAAATQAHPKITVGIFTSPACK